MGHNKIEIKKGVALHQINIDKFKTNLVAIFFTTNLNKENVTKNALISLILRRGSMNMPSQEQISKELEEMYGASFNCGLDKTGDNQVLKFYIETINNKYIPHNDENLWKSAVNKLLDITLNPYVENGEFKKEYVEQEKNTLKQMIEGRKDNKARYAMDRCIEEMYKKESFGLYKYGNIEEVEKIDNKSLYEYYNTLIQKCKIDIFVSGDINQDVQTMVKEDKNISKLEPRNPEYKEIKLEKKEIRQENIAYETMEVTQGKLVIGLDIRIDNEDQKYDVMVYNSILGGSANSKLFQNVREKEHLAYVASSSYIRHKNNILINCGIEIANYNKALNIVKKQLEDMKNGEFTENDLLDAKKGIIETIKTIEDEQDSQITYNFGQELANNNITLEEYIKRIEKISKEDIEKIANVININTIYFLKN